MIFKQNLKHMNIIILPNLQSTVTNKKFLLYDNHDHHRRLLVFASKEQLDFLSECESWYCDGTFGVFKIKTKLPHTYFSGLGSSKIICTNVFYSWFNTWEKSCH